MGRRVAVLYQALDPPLINGMRKPKKPGGYQDSGADIAYALKHCCNIEAITPSQKPDPVKDIDWCFADTKDGILEAVRQNATHLWANTILFEQHPLQTSAELDTVAKNLRIVGQPPKLIELYDDKNLVNEMLRARSNFTLPEAHLVHDDISLQQVLFSEPDLEYPVVGKPVRGRGSYGVKLCRNKAELGAHAQDLLSQNNSVIVEEYLAGQEATVTVMPPSKERPQYWALPIVERFNHQDGIAPYNGVVAITQNSRVITSDQAEQDPSYANIQDQCVEVAKLLHATAPIRVDVRRFTPDPKSPFALFDVNMKPNMTGPGRIGREDQASLTALAAGGIGWDYPTLLLHILESSSTLDELRNVKVVEREFRGPEIKDKRH